MRARAKAWAEVQAFFEALEARYDRARINESFLGLGLLFATKWVDLEAAVVQVQGHTATVFKRRATGRLEARQKLILEDGHWRVYFDDWDDESVKRMLAYGEPLAKAMRQTTPEIRAGKYEALDAVVRVMNERAKAAGLHAPDEPERRPAVKFERSGARGLTPGPKVSPDGRLTVKTIGHDAQMIEVATGEPIGPILAHPDNNRPNKRRVIWAFSPDGRLLATAFTADTQGEGDGVGYVRVWRVPTGEPLAKPEDLLIGYVHALAFSADATRLMIDCDPLSGR